MQIKRMSIVLTITLSALALMGLALTGSLQAAPGELEPGGLLVPLGETQADLRTAYRQPLAHLYDGGRLHWLSPDTVFTGTEFVPPDSQTGLFPARVQPGDFYLPPDEVTAESFCSSCTRHMLWGSVPISRAYALYPAKVAVMRSSVMVDIGEEGEVVAMWELAEIRQVLDGYLNGAVDYDVLTEEEIAAQIGTYDLLMIPAFRTDAKAEILNSLDESGALDAIAAFVENGGTLYTQGNSVFIAEATGILPEGTVTEENIALTAPDDIANKGVMEILDATSPLAYTWLTDTLYILDDPIVDASTEGLDVVARINNTGAEATIPAIVHYAYQDGQLISVLGHPTDPVRRDQIPVFMDALLMGLSGRADFYGDAVQTFNPDYPAHEFPAYESVPVSVTLFVENVWDETLSTAVISETVSKGYNVLSDTVSPAPSAILSTTQGTVIVWELGDLAGHAEVEISYAAQTEPETLAAGISTFSNGKLVYTDPNGKRVHVSHRPFILTAKMAARMVGDRDLEADRHYTIPEGGVYLDIALPLENKESTLGANLELTDWAYLIVPMVDYADQREILSTNDGETIWMLNEPYLWGGDKYPMPIGATSPTQTYTLDDWQGDWCVFTSPYGIHIDPAAPRAMGEDFGSFITIPPTYTDYLTVTADNELLLPCLPLTWDLGDFPGYWYEEPAVRYGIHSQELLGREVVFEGTPREGTVVIPNEAGSVYVLAGDYPIPFREHLDHADAYSAQAPSDSLLTYQDIWSRTHEMTLRAAFYDVWEWDACATCGHEMEQHAAANVTFGMVADLDGDGVPETPVREIPTRLAETQLTLLGKTRSVIGDDTGTTLLPSQNLIQLPIFKGLGIKIHPENETWWDSYTSLAPGSATLISVSEQTAYDHLLFQQYVPLGSSSSFVVSATIESYNFNREGLFKLHDGPRLVYWQKAAGPNRYEIYDGHVQAAEGISSDAEVTKQAGPTAVSVYSDTLIFVYQVQDPNEPRDFAANYDPYMKSWGYGDLVWTTYVGGREEKELFHSYLGEGDHSRVRISLDNNTGITLTNVNVSLDLPEGISAELLYTDPDTAPEPIWPELAFLNQTEVPDAWRSVWYFDLAVSEISEELWGQVIEIPVTVTADNLPEGYEPPAARMALRRDGDPSPLYVSGEATGLELSDVLPEEVELEAAKLVSDKATLDQLWQALDLDTGNVNSDTAGALFDQLGNPLTFTVDGQLVNFELPEDLQVVPSQSEWYVVAKGTLVRAHHGPNVVNDGPSISYTDPFSMSWTDKGPAVTVEAHGAVVWVDYECETEEYVPAAFMPAMAGGGECVIPEDGGTMTVRITAYNAGDAVARGVTVTLVLPDGVDATEATPPWHEQEGDTAIWNLGDLAPGAWREFVVVFRVDPDDTEWESSLEISKESNRDAVTEGETIDYTVVVKNTGETWLHTVVMTDVIPAMTTYVEDSAACEECTVFSYMYGTLNAYMAALPIGDAITLTFSVTVNDGAEGQIINTASASSEEVGPAEVSVSNEVVQVRVLDVSVTKQAQPASVPEPGGAVEFTVEVENTGDLQGTLTALTDSVYGDLNGKGNCATGTVLNEGDKYICSFETTINGDAGYTEVSTTTATLQDAALNTATDSDSTTVTVTDVLPTLDLALDVNPGGVVEPSGEVTYTVIVTNTSIEDVTLTMLKDDAVGDLTESGNCGDATGTVLEPDATYTCQFPATVEGELNDSINKTVTADGTDNEANIASDSDTATVIIIPNSQERVTPILECVKENDDASFTAYFGYMNAAGEMVSIPVGENNYIWFSGGEEGGGEGGGEGGDEGGEPYYDDMGQPTEFEPGRSEPWPNAPFNLNFQSYEEIAWVLGGDTALANSDSPRCAQVIYLDKTWLDADGYAWYQAPDDIPAEFTIYAESDLGTAICTYPNFTNYLECVYDNQNGLPNNGLWVSGSGTYTVTETASPENWEPEQGAGEYTFEDCAANSDAWGDECYHTIINAYMGEEQQQYFAARTLSAANAVGGRLMAIHHSDSEFFDDYSQQIVSGRAGDELWVKVIHVDRSTVVYLPMLLREFDRRADLEITAITGVDAQNPGTVEIHIQNKGNSTANAFWVDLYLDPSEPPTVNQPWTTLCETNGAAWFVESLGVGEEMVLTINGTGYETDQSRWPAAYAAGEHKIWAYVDTWGAPRQWGGVNESNENNNSYGPVTLNVTGSASTQPANLQAIPLRPLRP